MKQAWTLCGPSLKMTVAFFLKYENFLICGSAGKTEKEDIHCCATQDIFEKFDGSRCLREEFRSGHSVVGTLHGKIDNKEPQKASEQAMKQIIWLEIQAQSHSQGAIPSPMT